MTKTLLTGAALLVAGTASLAAAQTVPMNMPHAMPMLGMHPAPITTRSDVPVRVQALFARLDVNRDGALTQKEVQAAGNMGRRGRMGQDRRFDPAQRAAKRAQAFDRFDRDHNGVVTRDEFANIQSLRNGMRGQMHGGGMRMGMGGGMKGRMFAMADFNRDGRVTLAEATDIALRRFDRIDRNRDGRITPDEHGMMRRQGPNRRG